MYSRWMGFFRLIDMIDYFPKLSSQALSILAKSLSEDKLQKPFLRLLPKDHVKSFGNQSLFSLTFVFQKEKALLRNGLVRCLEFAEPDSENPDENGNIPLYSI